MKFSDLDKKMRVFETAHDLCVLPGMYLVARLDGRNFTTLTKYKGFSKPFDKVFRDNMVLTTKHLMNCGFNVLYGYTQSDEISLLFAIDETCFGRKLRKFNSILAGEASARFSLSMGRVGAFDCRISQLPSVTNVVDYFRWRAGDAHRNALNAICYWHWRTAGDSANKATARLHGLSVSQKDEMLFKRGVNFNDVSGWKKRGCGIYWQSYEKAAMNPITNEAVMAQRRRLVTDMHLPKGDTYSESIMQLIVDQGVKTP